MSAPRPTMAPDRARQRAAAFAQRLETRRSIRDFSTEPVPEGVIESAVRAAASAPSAANVQPWRFVVITDPELKRRLREAAESEER